MTTQPRLWGHADTTTRQARLFDEPPEDTGLSCGQCGEPLVRTASGFLCCPRGHGKLFEAANHAESWDFGEPEALC